MATNTKSSQSSSSHQDKTELIHLSGLPIGQELIPECEVILDGEEDSLYDRFRDCEKNPGHPNFIPVKKFGFEHLPEELRTEQIMRDIRRRCNLTVRVVVRYTSTNRPDTFYDSKAPYPYSKFKGSKRKKRYGTGYIKVRDKISERCPCPLCQKAKDPKMEYWDIIVQTATHVIYDDSEAKCSEFDCFYDSEDGAGVKKLYGVSMNNKYFVPGSNYKSDLSLIRCVTHDRETLMRLAKEFACTKDAVFDENTFDRFMSEKVIVSHPHGCSKRITVGNVLYRTGILKNCENPINFIKNTICRISTKLSSGSLQDKYINDIYKERVKLLLRAQTRSEIDNEPGFSKMWQPYIDLKSLKTDHKVYDIIIGITCGFYKFAVSQDLVSSFVVYAENIDRTLIFIISNRLSNMKNSDTKTPELIDIGLLLLRCFFFVLKNMLKIDFLKKEKNSFEVDGFIMIVFIYFMRPEFLPLFDLQQYVVEKSQEYLIRDREYYDRIDAVKIVVRILTRCDICSFKLRCNNVTTDYNEYGDDENAVMFYEIVISLCQSTASQPKNLQKHDQVNLRMKSLIDPENDDFLQPGTEFLLPPKTICTIPPDAKFFKRYYSDNPQYFRFPQGTKFYWVYDDDTMIPLFFLDDAEFFNVYMDQQVKLFTTYDIDTCPGCSGAVLCYTAQDVDYKINLVHSGTFGGNNISGTNSFTGYDNKKDGLFHRWHEYTGSEFTYC